MKYSLWLLPSEPVFSKLQEEINHLASQFNTPKFIPHLTLLADIEGDLGNITEKISELTKGFSVLHLSLGSVSFSTTYFQSVLVRVNSTSTLMEL